MKRRIKRILECVLTVVVLVAVLAATTRAFERKSSIYKLNQFFENKKDFDVLFLGTSHMMNDVMPMELWDEYGITSFNLAGQDSQIATDYWILMNALDYADSKVVVIDCDGISSNLKASDNYEYIHFSFDGFPLSMNKIKAAIDLTNDEEHDRRVESGLTADANEKRDPIGIIWNYSVYHSRWKELTEGDFNNTYSSEMGAESRVQIAIPNEVISVDANEKLDEETTSMVYLQKIIDECNKRGIKVVLTYLPYPASHDDWVEANSVNDVADRNGVQYINFLREDIVDYEIDCYDENSHLNPAGAKKVTAYLGDVLRSDYQLEDHREDSAFAKWTDMYQEYFEYKNKRLKDQDGLDQYLMMLADNDYEVSICVGDDKVYADAIYNKVAANCNIIDDSSMQVTEGQIKVRVIDAKSKEIIDEACYVIPEDGLESQDSTANGIWISSLAVKIEEQ